MQSHHPRLENRYQPRISTARGDKAHHRAVEKVVVSARNWTTWAPPGWHLGASRYLPAALDSFHHNGLRDEIIDLHSLTTPSPFDLG